MRNKMLIILVILVGLASRMTAQQVLTLSLDQARKYALEHNKMLKNNDYAISKAQMAIKEAIANGLPQVNAAADYSNAMGASISIRFNENLPPTEIPIKPQSNLNLTVGQLLFSANYIVGIQTARLAKDLSMLNREKSEIEISAQVSETYYMILVSENILSVLKQNIINLEKLLDKTQAMVRVGMMEQTNLDQLSVQVNAIKNSVKSSERQLELATNLMRLQLGVSPETTLKLTTTLDECIAFASSPPLLVFDFQKHIDFRLLNQQEYLGAKMIDMRRAAALPTFSAFYRHTYKILKPDFDMSPRNVIGLQLNIPIFSSGVRTWQVRQAGMDLKMIQNNKDLLADQLKIQEKQVRYNYTNALESFKNQQTNIEVARRVNQSLRNKYEQGLISGLDLINADNNYLRAETDYLSSALQLLSSELQVRKLNGAIN